MTDTLTANIDLDGVIFDLVNSQRERLAKDGIEGLRDPTSWQHHAADQWDVPDLWGRTRQWSEEEGFWATLQTHPEGIDFVEYLRETGWRIRIVTSKVKQGPKALADTVVALDTNGVPFDHLVFTQGDKHGYPADFVIDDSPWLDKWVQDNALNFIMERKWNNMIHFPANRFAVDGMLVRGDYAYAKKMADHVRLRKMAGRPL